MPVFLFFSLFFNLHSYWVSVVFSFLKFSSALRTYTQSSFVPFVLACLVRDLAYKFSDL